MLYRAASNVDSITDYNGFSPRHSHEVDGCIYLSYLRLLCKSVLFYYIINL